MPKSTDTFLGDDMVLTDWKSNPMNNYKCAVTRAKNWLEMELGLPPRRELWLIKAETLADAKRVAEYHFLFSNITMICPCD
jgi:hypothetical protein